MKIRLLAFGLAATLSGACAVSSADIEDVAAQASVDEQTSALRLAIGEYWAEFLLERESFDYGAVSTSGEYNVIKSQAESFETRKVAVSKVVAVTFVEPANKNGFVVERVMRDTEETESDNTTSFTRKLDAVDERASFVLFEVDSWVRQLQEGSGDFDATLGDALFPLKAQVRGLYTSDNGAVWKAELAEMAAGAPAIKLTRVFPETERSLSGFFAACFRETPGSAAGTKNYVYQTACDGTYVDFGGTAEFTLEHSDSIWVGKQRILKRVVKHERIRLDRINCVTGITDWSPLTDGLVDCAGTVSFGRGGPSKTISEATQEVTKFGAAVEKRALPEIADAE